MTGSTIADNVALVHALGPVAPSGSTPDYISLKDVEELEVEIVGLNGTNAAACAITLLQAKTVAGTNEKALPFTIYYKNEDTGSAAALTKADATSNTFSTTNTGSKSFVYRIPIRPAMLDVENGFNCVRAGTANAANTSIAVFYLVKPKYGGDAANMPEFITD